MIKTKVTYLNKEFVVEEEEPSTIPELVTLIGEEGVVTNAVANLRYRNKYPRVYKRVSIEVIKLGFPVGKNAKGEDQDDMQHIRAFATAEPGNRAVLLVLFERIAKEEPLFIRGDRAGGGGKVAQGALDAAHRYFAEGPEKVMEVVQTIEQMLPGYHVKLNVDDDGATPEALARGIQTLQRHLVSKAKSVTANL
jgi:hypothetical protein